MIAARIIVSLLLLYRMRRGIVWARETLRVVMAVGNNEYLFPAQAATVRESSESVVRHKAHGNMITESP